MKTSLAVLAALALVVLPAAAKTAPKTTAKAESAHALRDPAILRGARRTRFALRGGASV